MTIQFDISDSEASRVLAVLPSLGYIYDVNNPLTDVQQQWQFFINLTLNNWESEVFNYERSLAIANEPNDTAALQAQRYEFISGKVVVDNEKPWVAGEEIKIGMIRTEADKNYICVQAHTTQLGWEPSKVPALFTLKPKPSSGQLYPDWIQPTGAQDAYAVGARVRYNDQNWESTTPANVWAPGVFGWIVI